MSTVEEKIAELAQAERERREARAVASAERREAQRVADQARAAERRRREAERLVAAENAPSRQILGACWLCGSTDIPDGLTWISLPLPLGRIDGSTCAKCRRGRGDMAQQVTDRLWAEVPKLLEGWGWKRPKTRPDPYARGLSAEQRREIVEGIEGGQYENQSWSVAAEWWRHTWAHHLLEWRREHAADDKAKREPRPSRPFGWLK